MKIIDTTPFNIEPIIRALARKYLPGREDISLLVCKSTRLLDSFSKSDIKLDALLQKNGNDYTMVLRSYKKIVICHEFVHLLQYERGDLDLIDNNFWWQGKPSPSFGAYDIRPWEKEASVRQTELFKYLKSIGL